MNALWTTLTQAAGAAAAAAALTLAPPAEAARALYTAMPGDDLPQDSTSAGWYSATLAEGRLFIAPVQGRQASAWQHVERQTLPAREQLPEVVEITESTGTTLALPPNALLAFRFEDPAPLAVPEGGFTNALPVPVLLHTELRQLVNVGGERWMLQTEFQRRPDGGLLAGSMALVATRVGQGGNTRQVLVPPAPGMAFARQRLLWLGRAGTSGTLDLILERTWITGEVDHVLVIDGALGLAYQDPDRPQQAFSSGALATDSESRHAGQPALQAQQMKARAAFSIGEQSWNEAAARAEAAGVPAVLFDRQLKLGDEAVRFTVEHLPRWAGREGEASSASDQMFWSGPLIVKAHFRGRSQVLLQTGLLDSGNFRLQLGELDGQPALHVAIQPHYNNSFDHQWVWSAADGRFKRVARSQQQGC